MAFNVKGHDPMELARALNDAGVEARAGCHCATLAHQALGIGASCRLSFYLYNTIDEVERAVDALAAIVSRRPDAFKGDLHTNLTPGTLPMTEEWALQ